MTSKTYTYTADELRNKKSSAFLSAYSGGTVKITNVRFPGGHFELKFVRPEQVEINVTDPTGFTIGSTISIDGIVMEIIGKTENSLTVRLPQ